jgi:hypothetical protein
VNGEDLQCADIDIVRACAEVVTRGEEASTDTLYIHICVFVERREGRENDIIVCWVPADHLIIVCNYNVVDPVIFDPLYAEC